MRNIYIYFSCVSQHFLFSFPTLLLDHQLHFFQLLINGWFGNWQMYLLFFVSFLMLWFHHLVERGLNKIVLIAHHNTILPFSYTYCREYGNIFFIIFSRLLKNLIKNITYISLVSRKLVDSNLNSLNFTELVIF